MKWHINDSQRNSSKIANAISENRIELHPSRREFSFLSLEMHLINVESHSIKH